jgi:hypothetical protein
MESFLDCHIGFDEYITGNRFIDMCNKTGATFCKTDYLSEFADSYHKVFITHNSDHPINLQRLNEGPECGCWFAQNKEVAHDRVHSLPIGLENMTLREDQQARRGRFSSQVPLALQKAVLLDKINFLDLKKTGDVYMNFNINTYPQIRSFVWKKFENESWVKPTSSLSAHKFYFDLASHKFVISPRGNGVDCHRTWEALYLRTVPIVKHSIHMDDFGDLPIYFVNDWSELCYTKLKQFYEDRVVNGKFDLDKLKRSWWEKKIGEKLSE